MAQYENLYTLRNFFNLVIIILIILIVYKLIDVTQRFYHVLKIPGPERHPIFINSLHIMVDREQIIKCARQWAKDFYPVYSVVGLPLPFCSVNIVNPYDAELVLSSMKHSTKSYIYNFIHNWLQEGLLTSKGKKWQKRRKLLTPAFHFSLLQDFLEVFKQETKKLITVLEKKIEENGELNILPTIIDFTLFSINETAMGTKLDLNIERDKEYHEAVLEQGQIVATRLLNFWYYLDFVFYYFTPLGYRETKLVKILHKFSRHVIKSKMNRKESPAIPQNNSSNDYCYSNKKRMAMLDLLLLANKDNLIDFEGICEEVDTFMFEGHDTTAMSLCFTLLILANHKNAQDLILQEINDVIGDKEVDFHNLNEMKYLEMCIKESLRLFPSVPFISRTTDEDFKLATMDVLVKTNTLLNVHIFDVHRDPNIYPDPDKFDPSRFLPENIAKRHPFAYIPFSAGPRNCIGQKFAMLELKTAIIGILRKFELKPLDTVDGITIIADIVLRPKNDSIRVKFVKRS